MPCIFPLYSPVNVLYYRATSNRIAKKEVYCQRKYRFAWLQLYFFRNQARLPSDLTTAFLKSLLVYTTKPMQKINPLFVPKPISFAMQMLSMYFIYRVQDREEVTIKCHESIISCHFSISINQARFVVVSWPVVHAFLKISFLMVNRIAKTLSALPKSICYA